MRDKETGFYKIGKSIDPSGRLRQLMKQDTLQPKPNDFVLIEAWWGDERIEKYLHDLFFRERRRGEWFEFGPEHRAQIERYFDTYQPFTVAHRPGSLEKELRDAREELNRLRYDLQSANSKHVNYVRMVEEREKRQQQDRLAELTLGELEPVLEKPQPRLNRLRILEETKLGKRRKA